MTNQLKSLVIVGAGGLGREVAWLVYDINQAAPEWDFIGFVDDGKEVTTVEGYPLLGPVDLLFTLDDKPWVVVAIANSKSRKAIVEKLAAKNIKQATLIHPSANCSKHNRIGKGSIICCGSVITTNVVLGSACIINPNCFVGHDTILEDYVSLMPASNVAGEVHVGTGCFFGINSCVINQLDIGEWSTIGAGSTVISDIPPMSLAVGTPARVVKRY